MIAAQFYTLREFTKTGPGFRDCLRKVSEMGYTGVQLSAVGCMNGDDPEVSAALAREWLDEYRLKCVATHRNWQDLARKTHEEIEFHHTLGCDYTAIGGLSSDYGDGIEGFRRFLRDSAPVITRLKADGIRFGYHNHAHEFIRENRGGPTHYDLFIAEGGPDFYLEIDTYWVNHAGVGVAELFERCHGRVPVIHVKDKEVVPGDGPVMAPVGEGNLPWDGILAACKAAGVEWYVVEQDTYRRDPFDCLESSFGYLAKKLGV